MFLLGLFKEFFAFFVFVSFHELGHIFVARIFNAKTERIVINFIGEMVVIKDIEFLPFFKKFSVFIAGPLVNILFGILFLLFEKTETFLFLSKINFLLAFFNLLPVYPLDGGRILNLILNQFFPIIISNKIVIKISFLFSLLFMFFGFLQVMLFPYNLSLFCIGLYLFKTKYSTYFNMTFNFYKYILKKKGLFKDILPVKVFYVDGNFEIKKIMKMIYINRYCVFFINSDKNKNLIISEWDVIEYIQKKGSLGRLIDIVANK